MIGGDFDLFARVVESGSLSSAGRELGMSPAAVSKRLKKLEDRLGVRLLHRTTRRIALTEMGRGFHARVLSALDAIETAESFVSESSAPAVGLLRVSAPTAFGRLHIAPNLKPFLDANPEIQLELNLTDEFVDLVEGGYDLAIRVGSRKESGLTAFKLIANERILCASKTYLQTYGEPKTVEELEGHRLIARSTQTTWKMEGPNGAETVRVSPVLSTNSTEVVREAMLSGMGIALRSSLDIGDAIDTGRVRRVMPLYKGAPDNNLYAIYPSRRFVPPKVGVFIAYLADLYGHEPYWKEARRRAP